MDSADITINFDAVTVKKERKDTNNKTPHQKLAEENETEELETNPRETS